MKIKQYAALLVTAASLVGCTAAAYGESSAFVDISYTDWYYSVVYEANELGLMGFADGYYFRPYNDLTRGDFIRGLYVLAGKPEESNISTFTDVTEADGYAPCVNWAVENGIASGISETEFGLNEPITREAAAIMLYTLYADHPTDYQLQLERKDVTAYAKENGLLSSEEVIHFGPYEPLTWRHNADFIYTLFGPEDEDTPVYSASDFWDFERVDESAKPALEWALAEGIISGTTDQDGDPLLNAEGVLTKLEGAIILTNISRDFYNVTAEVEIPVETDFDPSQITSGETIPVLMYHEVSDDVWGIPYLFVSPSNMREELQYLKENGYDTIFFSDLDNLEDYDKPIILTLDDGYEGNYTELFPLLKEYNMKVTIFVIADDINKENFLTEDQLREMSDSGLVSIQSHTYSHSKLDTLETYQLYNEFEMSKNTIARITGKVPYVVSYPQGMYTGTSNRIAKEYFLLGILDRGGLWTSSDTNLFTIPRTVIPRDYTLQEFITTIDPPLVAPITSNALGSSISVPTN